MIEKGSPLLTENFEFVAENNLVKEIQRKLTINNFLFSGFLNLVVESLNNCRNSPSSCLVKLWTKTFGIQNNFFIWFFVQRMLNNVEHQQEMN
jgi:hypothetical protein